MVNKPRYFFIYFHLLLANRFLNKAWWPAPKCACADTAHARAPSVTCIACIFIYFGCTKLYSLAHPSMISRNSLRNLIKSASSLPGPWCETAAEELAASCSRSDPKAGGDARLQKNAGPIVWTAANIVNRKRFCILLHAAEIVSSRKSFRYAWNVAKSI